MLRVSALACAGGLALAGCASPGGPLDLDSAGLRRRVVLEDVAFHPQAYRQCGPSALATVLVWSGVDVTPGELAPLVYSPERKGSLQSDLVAAARIHDRVAYPLAGVRELLAEVDAGRPVLVLQNLGFALIPVWHYAVVIGYDLDRRSVALHTGSRARREVPLRVFRRTWARADDWAVAVLPPTLLPAAGDEQRYLAAVAGLERAGRWDAAAAAFELATRRWPSSATAWIGVGNARYGRRDLAGAETAFRTAARLDPKAAPAANNLAHVLGEQGRVEEALIHARRALELGGPHAARYLETLRELERRQARQTPGEAPGSGRRPDGSP